MYTRNDHINYVNNMRYLILSKLKFSKFAKNTHLLKQGEILLNFHKKTLTIFLDNSL